MAERLTRSKDLTQELLDRAISQGTAMRDKVTEAEPYVLIDSLRAWNEQVKKLLAGLFADAEPIEGYPGTLPTDSYFRGASSLAGDKARVYGAFDSRVVVLQAIKDRLDLYEDSSDVILAGQDHPAPRLSTSVFIVHGREEGPKYEVARFLEQATNTQPVILHEQAKRGKVIIETLETYAATAAFAIVLLTADDRGGLANSEENHSRARQNVVFELGFFIGALGRSRVAVLYQEGIELPSDMNGILYTVLDSQGAWKLSLGRELRAAGFAVDLNLAT
jgi:predicted nucleotide-binding protein